MESLLGASPSLSSLNLSSCLSGERQFKLLLVALPSYPTVREIRLCKNGLDDG